MSHSLRTGATALLLAVALVGCDSLADTEAFGLATTADAVAPSARPADSPVTHFQTFFGPVVAGCGEPIGDIRFSGMIQGTDHTTVDGNGETHRTRQFRVKGITGLNLKTDATYTVQGGAEMLTWHTQLGQTPGAPAKSFHAGTLVFSPDAGGARVVAHHAIRYVENAQGEVVLDFHDWSCRTSGR